MVQNSARVILILRTHENGSMVSGKKAKEERRRQATTATERRVARPPVRGDSPALVQRRRERYARALVARGVCFPKPKARSNDYQPGLDLVNEHLGRGKVCEVGENDFVLVAKSSEGDVIGALVCQLMTHNDDALVLIRFLVTRPDWRGHGVGHVLTCLLPQFVEDLAGAGKSVTTAGNCTTDLTGYYQQLGFDVAAPGQRISLPVLGSAEIPPGSDDPCWFTRSY